MTKFYRIINQFIDTMTIINGGESYTEEFAKDIQELIKFGAEIGISLNAEIDLGARDQLYASVAMVADKNASVIMIKFFTQKLQFIIDNRTGVLSE